MHLQICTVCLPFPEDMLGWTAAIYMRYRNVITWFHFARCIWGSTVVSFLQSQPHSYPPVPLYHPATNWTILPHDKLDPALSALLSPLTIAQNGSGMLLCLMLYLGEALLLKSPDAELGRNWCFKASRLWTFSGFFLKLSSSIDIVSQTT